MGILTGISASSVLGPQIRPGAPAGGAASTSTDLTVPSLGSLAPTTPAVAQVQAQPSMSPYNLATQSTATPVGMLTQAASQNATGANATAANGPNLAQLGPNGEMNKADSTNTASQLDSITSANSPYIQLAEQQGLLSAAGRGLENSSIGAGAAEAAAVAAAAPLAQQNASEAATGAEQTAAQNQQANMQTSAQQQTAGLQNAQLGTQASEFNSSQDTAAKELSAQLGTSVSQSNAQLQTSNAEFNAQQTQSAEAANAAATNQMSAQTAALTEDLNKQDLSGTQAANLAKIQASSNQLIAQNQSAASLYSTFLSSMSATMANKDISPSRAADTMGAMQSMVTGGLGVIDAISGMSLNVTQPSISGYGGSINVNSPGSVSTPGTAPAAPAAPPATKNTQPFNPYNIFAGGGMGRR